jgi:branched-chain amino acid transport system substrate-binding protein
MKTGRFVRAFYFGLIVLMAIFTISLVLRDVSAAADKEPIKIGALCALSGPQYVYTNPVVNAINLAIKEVNASGGILGRQLELITRDDEGKVDVGVREAKDLILRKKVDVLFGGPGSHIVLAVSEVAKTYKIPLLCLLGNSKTITEEKWHRYVFQLTPSTRMEGNAVAIFTAKKGWKKIWTLNSDYEYGRTSCQMYLEKLKQLVPDVNVIGQSWPKFGETDYTPYISAILAAKPDFVYSSMSGTDAINFTKQAKGYGFFEKVVGCAHYDFSVIQAIGAEMVEGAVGFNRGEFYCVDTPEMKVFLDKYRKAYGGNYPNAFSGFGYEAVYCVKQAMEKAKSSNKEKVVDALEGMEFIGPRGKLHFRVCDHMANGANYIGLTTKSPDYPFYILKDIMVVPAEQTLLSCEELKNLRAKK